MTQRGEDRRQKAGRKAPDRKATDQQTVDGKKASRVLLWVMALLLAVVIGAAVTSSSRWLGVGSTTGAAEARPAPEQPQRLRVRVLAEHEHDTAAYTQGLLWHEGSIFESTGLYGHSSLRRWSFDSELLDRIDLRPELFGEGLAQVGDHLVQITWREGVALRYALSDLDEPAQEIRFRGEGWGLTFDGTHLVMSDGTHILYYLDPLTLETERRLSVTRAGVPQDRLNELEWVEGSIYANVYQTDTIVQINPADGRVLATIDASGLLSPLESERAEVLNGIAYRQETGTFLLTGKYWPRLFEVEFEPVPIRSGGE